MVFFFKVFWFKDGKQISKRSRHYLTSCSDDGVCELRIPEIYAEDDGNYTALATNPLVSSSIFSWGFNDHRNYRQHCNQNTPSSVTVDFLFLSGYTSGKALSRSIYLESSRSSSCWRRVLTRSMKVYRVFTTSQPFTHWQCCIETEKLKKVLTHDFHICS